MSCIIYKVCLVDNVLFIGSSTAVIPNSSLFKRTVGKKQLRYIVMVVFNNV